MRIFTFILLTIVPACLFADSSSYHDRKYQVGDYFRPYQLETQHEVPHRMSPETRVVLVSFNMSLSKRIHQWLKAKNKDFLTEHQTEYIADISQMPSIITYLFAGPKMRSYEFPIIWARDESFAKKYPQEEEKITAFQLDQHGIIRDISFLKSMNEVAEKIYAKLDSAQQEAGSKD